MPTNEYNRIRYAERKAKGICCRCSNPVVVNKPYCESCRVKHVQKCRRRRPRLADSNCCVSCGKLREQKDKKHCNVCLSRIGTRALVTRAARIAAGLCGDCGCISSFKRCELCYLKMLSTNYFGTTKKHSDLKTLYDQQNGRCPYTGRLLTLGSGDCELDHKHPRSKGGGNELENLEWVYTPINQMKHSLTKPEFLTLVNEMSAYTRSK